MSMSRDEMELRDPEVSRKRKLAIRAKWFLDNVAQIAAGTVVIILSVILAVVVIFGLVELLF